MDAVVQLLIKAVFTAKNHFTKVLCFVYAHLAAIFSCTLSSLCMQSARSAFAGNSRRKQSPFADLAAIAAGGAGRAGMRRKFLPFVDAVNGSVNVGSQSLQFTHLTKSALSTTITSGTH